MANEKGLIALYPRTPEAQKIVDAVANTEPDANGVYDLSGEKPFSRRITDGLTARKPKERTTVRLIIDLDPEWAGTSDGYKEALALGEDLASEGYRQEPSIYVKAVWVSETHYVDNVPMQSYRYESNPSPLDPEEGR